MSFFKRFSKGSSSRFSKPTSVNPKLEVPSLPTPQEEERAPRPTPKANRAQEEAKESEDAVIDHAIDPPAPSARSQLKKPAPKIQDGQELTGTRTEGNEGTESAYTIFWRPEVSYSLIPTRKTKINRYIPNGIPLFKILEAAERRINVSKHIQTHEPTYLPYAVKVYYAVMFYMQILEARSIADDLEGYETSLLKRFKMKFPFNSLPCAESVYPYFNTIHATEIADEKYDWIVPTYAPGMLHAAMTDVTSADGSIYLQPQLPHMIAMLNSFIHQTQATLNQRMIGAARYEPVDISVDHAEAFGLDLRVATSTDAKSIFSACGVSTPFTFGNQNYLEAQRYAVDSDFADLINLVVNPNDLQNVNNARVTKDCSTIENFLYMEKATNMRWFEYVREQAIIHCRFHDKIYHFSDVQAVGGLETTVCTQLKLETDLVVYYSGHRLYNYDQEGVIKAGNAQHAVTWYPKHFERLTAGFMLTRGGIRRNEELQALTFGINATLPIRIAQAGNPLGQDLRVGPIWANQEMIRELFWNHTLAGKPMYSDYRSTIIRMYRETPHGTGVVDNEF